MIVRTLNQVSLNFGKGDIAINSGHIKKENDVNLGILGFFNQDPDCYRPPNFLKFRIIERSTNATFLCGTMPVDFDKKTLDMYAPKAIKEIQNIKNTIYENIERLEGYNEYH